MADYMRLTRLSSGEYFDEDSDGVVFVDGPEESLLCNGTNEKHDQCYIDSALEDDQISQEYDQNQLKGRRNKTIFGYGLALLGVVGLTSGMACTQALDKSVPHSQLNGFRFLAQFLLTSPLLVGFRRCDVRVEKTSVGWLAFGAVVLTTSSYMSYGSAYYLPLGIASGVTRSLGLVMNYTISCYINKTVHWYEFIASVLCLTGVTMVTQPPFLFNTESPALLNFETFHSPCHIITPLVYSQHENLTVKYNDTVTLDWADFIEIPGSKESHVSNETISMQKLQETKEEVIGYILCVTEAILSTTYIQLVSRKLSHLSIYVYNFWTSLFGFTISFCIMGLTETPVFPVVSVCIAFLFIHMISAGTHNILLYRAYQLISPVVAALILTLQIASTFVLQYTVLSGLHPGHANAVEISGAVLIFVGNGLVPMYEALKTYLLFEKSEDVLFICK